MKILFVSIHIAPGARAVPLGAASVAASVASFTARSGEAGGHHLSGSSLETELVDFFLGDDLSAAADELLSRSPEAVGFSIYLWNRSFTLSLARKLREAQPELLLFAGGPEPTADSAGFADSTIFVDRAGVLEGAGPLDRAGTRKGAGVPRSLFDFIVAGEGELATVSGLIDAFADRKSVGLGEPTIYREPAADLTILPSPWLAGVLNPAGMDGAVWELSRGCPFRCDFCFESRGEGRVRLFSLERIEQELKLFASSGGVGTSNSGVKELFVLDPTFNYNRPRAKELLQLFGKIAPGIRYYLEIRSEFIDPELAELFSSLSCSLQIGLQSAHPEVLGQINRELDREDCYEKVLLLHQAGVDYGFDLIYGLPGDSFEGFLESIDFAFTMVPNHLDIFPLAVLPGTRLSDTAAGLGLIYDSSNPYLVQGSASFSEDEMARSAAIARGIDLFYNQGGAVTWFDILLGQLEMEASRFFLTLSDWLEGEKLEMDLRNMQAEFVEYLFSQGPGSEGPKEEKGASLSPEGMVMVDMIRLFGGPGREIPFFYNPVELLACLDSGIRAPEELVYTLPRCNSTAHIDELQGEIEIFF